MALNAAYLLTGGNVGDRFFYLQSAAAAIAQCCGDVVRSSPVFETEAWGGVQQGPYLNQCLHLQTPMDAETLLQAVLQIERSLGRERMHKYSPRTLDIDLLFFNDEVIDQPGLHVPHPHLHQRRFVLVCLHALAPEKVHPVLGKTVAELLATCSDPLAVHKFS